VAETGGNEVWAGFLLSSLTAGLLSESLLGFLAALLLLVSFSLPEGGAGIEFYFNDSQRINYVHFVYL
jgi:hypothetical protein